MSHAILHRLIMVALALGGLFNLCFVAALVVAAWRQGRFHSTDPHTHPATRQEAP